MITKNTKELVYTNTLRKVYGLTPSMIEEIGPPDETRGNPHYRVAPDAGLYSIARVEAWIASNQDRVDKARVSRVKRSAASKTIHERKRAERREKELEWANGLQIECRKPLPATLVSDARRRFTFSKRAELLEQRALHAHVRSDFTNYEDLLGKLRKAEFEAELRPLLRQRVDAVVKAALLEWSQQRVEDDQEEQRQEQPRIYADACVQQGRAGLGVVGDGWQLSIERVADSIIEGECLAVLLACEEAKKRNIVAPLIFSDNKLVVDWANQCRGRRSESAQRFAPRIREALEVSALRWILRGLSVDKAIRKVEMDREIGHEIAERREAALMAEWEDDD